MAKNSNQKKGSIGEHQRLVSRILLKLSKLSYCRIWPNNTGVGRSMNGERVIRFGLKGSADIMGIYKGFFLGIECKTGNATQTKQQKFFEAMVREQGGIYILARTEENIIQTIEEEFEECLKNLLPELNKLNIMPP